MPDESLPPDPTSPLPTDEPGGPDRPTAVVGIGGSAGALDGYERFFLSLPGDSGIAFVVVPHLDPNHPGLMPEILARCTTMPVVQIEDGMPVLPDRVHVIPPGHSLTIMNGTLLLEGLDQANGNVIDTFLESLAADQGERAIAVILSGMGSDGARGVLAIKEHFGRVMVQDPQSAEYSAMPRSSLATQIASDVLPAEELAPRLYSAITRRRTLRVEDVAGADGQPSAPLQKILRLVRVRTGHDFTRYKRSTLVRRIDRRMKNRRIDDIAQYVRVLQESQEEVEALFQDFTINVTSFFRDSEAFEELKDHLRTYILANKQDMDNVRVWVAGCSTGEEAYSVGIVLYELMEELRDERAFKVQLFATDIDSEAIEKARYGLYPRDLEYVVSPERLARYFEPREGGYQVRTEVRDLVVFATHNTFGDPPFTRLDLLCCRNMLIYLNAELQQQIMTVFHYALRPRSILFLGASETTGTDRERFAPLNTRWKIYQRGDAAAGPLPVGQILKGGPITAPAVQSQASPRASRQADVSQVAMSMLLANHAPPAVVINEHGDILHVHGRTGRYLELPAGRTQTNVFEMARGTLRYELPVAVRQAITDRAEVRRAGIVVEVGGLQHVVDIVIRPLQGRAPELMLIEFQERTDGAFNAAPAEKTDHVEALERELQHSKESLQATIEEMAVSMEELKSTNEELQTANEELQSTNEELQTANEELQSLNEELTTINAEHQRVIHDLAQANDDMKNLLESAGIATVFLSNALRIKRFTPRITRVINLMPVDVGRPITDISVNLRYDHLTRDIARVLDTLEVFETQVQTHDDQWYLMRISPYRTSDNFIDGVVVAFTNIDRVKTLERQISQTTAFAERALNSLHDPIVILTDQLRVVTANQAFHHLLHTAPSQVAGERLYDIGNFVLDVPDLQRRLRDVVATHEPVVNEVIVLDVPRLGRRRMKLEVDPLDTEEHAQPLYLLKLEDITDLLDDAAYENEPPFGQGG